MLSGWRDTMKSKITCLIISLILSISLISGINTVYAAAASTAVYTTSAVTSDNADSYEELKTIIIEHLVNLDTSFSIRLNNYTYNKQQFEGTLSQAISTDDFVKYSISGYAYQAAFSTALNYTDYSITITWLGTPSLSYLNQEISTILKSIISDKSSEYDKAKAIHDYLCANITYDLSANPIYDATGALKNKKGVCQAYSLLFYKMSIMAGLNARIISGTAESSTGSGDHAWNLVRIGENWCQVDTTWDSETKSTKPNKVVWDYFLKSDAAFQSDHSWIKSDYPAAAGYKAGSAIVTPPPVPQGPFSDIGSHWAKEKILELYNTNIVNGYSDSTFRPNASISRCEIAVILTRALDYTAEDDSAIIGFKDYSKIPQWARLYVAAAVENGLMSGYEDNTIRVDHNISRAEIAAVLVRSLGTVDIVDAETDFADDSSIPAWAKKFVAEASSWGIINGTNVSGAYYFRPTNNTTRAETCTMISNLLNIKQLI